MTRFRWLIVLIVVLGLAAFFAFRSIAASQAAQADFQTEAARRGSLTASIGATGTVRANQTAVLAFETSGTVEQVSVELGGEVAEGELLASLRQTSLPSQVILAQADLVAAQKALEDLLESDQARAEAQLALAQAQDALSDTEYRWRVQQPGQRASGETIAAAEANLVLAEQEVELAEAQFNRFSGRPEDDPARALARSNLAAARQQRDAILRQLNWYTGAPTDIDQAILDAELSLAQARLADARRAWQRVENGANPDDILAAEARIAAARATLESARLTAPFSGSVTSVQAMPGDQVSPGAMAFRLDDLSRLLIDVEVSEIDINSIELGQPVTVTFDAVLDREYEGIVVEVGLAGSIAQGVVTFPVTIELIDPDAEVRPGMTAAVNFIVSQLESVLLVPNRAVRLIEGERAVYILGAGPGRGPAGLTPVMIELGASSDLYSEVVSGDLREGDLIVLNPPTIFEQDGPPPFVGGG